ncbi:MAG: serine/threonine-protein kinase RsbW [Rhodobacteraceae bacterium HLUCCO07]|nr:MAG: serine/threonine-protein kinase RsbW [Rhodobacteraceae bacterium HLUCCO07]
MSPKDIGMPEPFCLAFASTELAVRAALNELTTALFVEGHDDSVRSTAEIVLGEVLNNIVEHAYGPDRQGEIELCCESGQNALWVTVCDRGAPMPGLRLPSGRPVELDGVREDLPEGGFGWFLVHSLAENLDYCRAAGRNRLSFAVPYGHGPDPDRRDPVQD